MGTDPNEDSVTEIDVEVESSAVAEITTSGAGDVSPRASADMASPADAEPRTLQPQMAVRGLGPALPPPTLSPPTVSFPRAQPSPGHDGENDETALNVDDRLLEVIAAEQRQVRASKASFGPIITPSEPHLVTSPRSPDPPAARLDGAPTAKGLGAEPLAIPTVGAPTASAHVIDSDSDLHEPTAKRAPLHTEVDDETATDAMRMLASQEAAGRGEEASAIAGVVGTMPLICADGAVPDSERPGRPGAPGGTLRMNLPKNTSSLVYGDEALRVPTPAPFALPAREPALAPPPEAPASAPPAAAPLPEFTTPPPTAIHPTPPPPAGPDSYRAGGGVPAPGPTMRTRPRKKRGIGRVLPLLFLLSLGAAGGALYRWRYGPAWVTPRRSHPVAAVAPSAAPQVALTPSVAPSALDPLAADASALEAAPADASATDASGAVAAPSASSSGRGRGRGRPPRH